MPAKKQKVSEDAAEATTFDRYVICNGLPGAMGKEVAHACFKRGLKVAPFALTGPNMPESVEVDGIGKIDLINAAAEGSKERFEKEVSTLKEKGQVIAIDFTHPLAVNSNADLYNSIKLPFVMGTTGGDRDRLLQSTQSAKNHAVIAPNMCKQIVAFQAMFEFMEKNFPGSFDGYELSVTESHQKTKADTSGTAKAVVKSLSVLTGKEFPEDSIKKVRGDEESKAFGVPEQYIGGHAHHTYHLESADKTVVFVFKHNVNGRSTYAEGVADAAIFLAGKANSRNKPKVYNMIDILKSGGMA